MAEPIVSIGGPRDPYENISVRTQTQAMMWLHDAANYCKDEAENYYGRLDWTPTERNAFLAAAATLDKLFLGMGT